ncbi:MAG: hypothetical protein IPN94_19935 [Sphingobacteriales bacterium]|nr:hypothetical protein [Sphingobacteriales bacterium]
MPDNIPDQAPEPALFSTFIGTTRAPATPCIPTPLAFAPMIPAQVCSRVRCRRWHWQCLRKYVPSLLLR